MTQSKKDNDNDIVIVNTGSLSDSITISDYVVDTIDISNMNYDTTYATSTDYTFSVSDTISLDGIVDNLTNITFNDVEFENTMPKVDKVKKMCEYYPALEKAYENFKTIYKMVDQDYKGNYENDEDVPF